MGLFPNISTVSNHLRYQCLVWRLSNFPVTKRTVIHLLHRLIFKTIQWHKQPCIPCPVDVNHVPSCGPTNLNPSVFVCEECCCISRVQQYTSLCYYFLLFRIPTLSEKLDISTRWLPAPLWHSRCSSSRIHVSWYTVCISLYGWVYNYKPLTDPCVAMSDATYCTLNKSFLFTVSYFCVCKINIQNTIPSCVRILSFSDQFDSTTFYICLCHDHYWRLQHL